MKTMTGCLLFVLVMFTFSLNSHAAVPTKVEVLYMNHGPLMDTLSKMKAVFSQYGDRLTVSWYDFDTAQGEQFMAKKGIHEHVPLLIWVGGNTVVKVNQKEITFAGFPTGSGPASFQGKWTLDDLKTALSQVTSLKK